MNGSRREALLGRYRARSIERIGQLEAALERVRSGQGDEELRREIARGLHTLKGDSTVVGLEPLAHAAHATEELFLASHAGEPGAEPPALLLGLIGEALSTLKDVLRQELDAAQSQQPLEPLEVALRAALAGAHLPAPAPSAPAEPPPAAAAQPAQSCQSAPKVPEIPAAPKPHARRWIQVQGERIDAVCEAAAGLSGRLEALATQLEPLLEAVSRERRGEARAALESLDRCGTTLESLVASAWSLRMVEVEPALEELVSHGRALAAALGKQVRVEVRAPGVEVERGVLDELQEPLLHLVRNALDHGIEPPAERGAKDPVARLLVEARTVGPLLLLRLSDDGRGIDLETVRAAAVRRGLFDEQAAARLTEAELRALLFAHGFSTRKEVSEISGRGVGLDVVRTRLSALGGSVALETKLGAGTSFTLTVPARVTREKVLLFESAGALWGLPGESVEEVRRIGEGSLEAGPTGQALLQRGERVTFRSFRELLGGQPGDDRWAIVIAWGERRCALGAASVVGEAELLRRPADRLVSSLGPIAASGSSGDGRLVLLVSLEALFDRLSQAAPARPAQRPAARRRQVLVVDDSATVRDFVVDLLTQAGIEARPAPNGQVALALLQQSPPDLVLTDLEMPGMSGLELLTEVRARHPRMPVVMLTTRGSPEDRRRAAELGATAYLVKTQLQESTLLETLARSLGDRS